MHFTHHHAHISQCKVARKPIIDYLIAIRLILYVSGFTCVDGDRDLFVTALPLRASPTRAPGANETLYCIYEIPDNGPANITIQWYHYYKCEKYLMWTAANWIGNSVNEAANHHWSTGPRWYKERLTGSTVNFPNLRHGHSITFQYKYRPGAYLCEVEVKFSRSQAHWSGGSPIIVITIDCKHLTI